MLPLPGVFFSPLLNSSFCRSYHLSIFPCALFMDHISVCLPVSCLLLIRPSSLRPENFSDLSAKPGTQQGLRLLSPTHLTLYCLWSVPICYIRPTRCPHDSCGLMSVGILLLRNVLAAANPGGNTVHSLQAEVVPKAQEPSSPQPSDHKSFHKGA